VRHEYAAGRQARVQQVEELLVVGLPRVEKHEIESARQPRNYGEAVALHDLHDAVQAGGANVRRCFLGSPRVVLDRNHASAAFARAKAEPDTAVAARRTDLEHRFRAARGDQYAQEPSVFLRHRELTLVGRFDAAKHLLHARGERHRGPDFLRESEDDGQ
jgi:hypothetical protein